MNTFRGRCGNRGLPPTQDCQLADCRFCRAGECRETACPERHRRATGGEVCGRRKLPARQSKACLAGAVRPDQVYCKRCRDVAPALTRKPFSGSLRARPKLRTPTRRNCECHYATALVSQAEIERIYPADQQRLSLPAHSRDAGDCIFTARARHGLRHRGAVRWRREPRIQAQELPA